MLRAVAKIWNLLVTRVRMSGQAVQQMRNDEDAHAAPFLTRSWRALSEFCNSELDTRRCGPSLEFCNVLHTAVVATSG